MDAADKLSRQLARVDYGVDKAAIAHIYNPYVYARDMHRAYMQLALKTKRKRVVLVGMNPGPWGMAQTGVPFGEVNLVRDWMKLKGEIKKPRGTHPKRPVLGLACARSEVSGARLWGAVAERHKKPADFFRHTFVSNWCPLLFLEQSARNLPPDKFKKQTRDKLARVCDAHLAAVLDVTRPRWVLGVGVFAEDCAGRALDLIDHKAKLGRILHPSPASPKANQGWAPQARAELKALGIDVVF